MIARACVPPAPRPAALVAAVAEHYGFTIAQLRAPARLAYLVRARRVGLYLALTAIPGMSLRSAARLFGLRDHGSAYEARRVVEGDAGMLAEAAGIREHMEAR